MARKSSVSEPHYTSPPEVEPEDKPSQAENIISVVLGLAVVLVIGAMIVNAIKNRNNPTPTPSPEQQEQEQKMATVSAMHTVEPGETLWSIAEKYYNDGFKWTEIKKANNLPTDNVEKGTELMIPKLESTGTTISPTVSPEVSTTVMLSPTVMPTAQPSPTQGATGSMGATGNTQPGQTSSTSTSKEYTVVAGDTLWAIAQKTYNDPYKWVDIAKANNLKNPNVIHVGNKFILP